MATSQRAWDAEAGVWVGNMAQSSDIELPKPLVIFGYGSLCWRPDTTLEAFESFPCLIKGWARLFSQRSTDHRGTPDSPGLVATMCEVTALASLPGFDAATTPDATLGRAYVVPDTEAPRVLAELDFREKGGYTRQVVDVERLDDRGSVRALLYSGTIDNPNFWWGDDGSGFDLDRAAAIVASAVGPSGANVEYLRNLSAFLQAEGHRDSHVAELEKRVNELTT